MPGEVGEYKNDVRRVELPNGDHAIGAKIGDAFVTFARVPAARVRGEQQRVADLRARAEAGDDAAAEVLANTTGEGAKDAAEAESGKGA